MSESISHGLFWSGLYSSIFLQIRSNYKLVNDVNFFEYKRPAYIQRNTGSNKKVTSNKPRPDNDHSGRSSRLVCGSNPSVPTVLHGRPNRPIRPTRPTNPADPSDQPNRPAVPT
ncbi:hypothetical protein BpHYR1_000411 [Brachionus plicatilis]|uniref:Uncharacterized protein n=1 Tax=Brachionus plicatilis TaxID=10195 RepID=A0A3M7QU51_BRAPC|nr:hypothetical protein BpHYR1_000411 [Brachionus plicatilis]